MSDTDLLLEELNTTELCTQCGRPMEVHRIPWGEPVFLLRTGFCQPCQRPLLGIEGVERDARSCALELAEFFQGVAGSR